MHTLGIPFLVIASGGFERGAVGARVRGVPTTRTGRRHPHTYRHASVWRTFITN